MDEVKLLNDSFSVIREEKRDPFMASPPREATTRKRGFCLRIAVISDFTSEKILQNNRNLKHYKFIRYNLEIVLKTFEENLYLLSERCNCPYSLIPMDVYIRCVQRHMFKEETGRFPS